MKSILLGTALIALATPAFAIDVEDRNQQMQLLANVLAYQLVCETITPALTDSWVHAISKRATASGIDLKIPAQQAAADTMLRQRIGQFLDNPEKLCRQVRTVFQSFGATFVR
jgi:hypothetical protein